MINMNMILKEITGQLEIDNNYIFYLTEYKKL